MRTDRERELDGNEREKPERPLKNGGGERPARIIDKRDERGIPYPGSFPNPLRDRDRGCF